MQLCKCPKLKCSTLEMAEIAPRRSHTVWSLMLLPKEFSLSSFFHSTCSACNYSSDVSDHWRFTDLIAPITDPEHPLSLSSLGVVKLEDVHLVPPPDLSNPAALSRVLVELTPTVTHCSLATVIGLGVRVRLEQALPPSYRVEVKIKKGTHSSAEEVNKQLADKERVAAALENANLANILRKMLQPCDM